jgi:hypothetical protein
MLVLSTVTVDLVLVSGVLNSQDPQTFYLLLIRWRQAGRRCLANTWRLQGALVIKLAILGTVSSITFVGWLVALYISFMMGVPHRTERKSWRPRAPCTRPPSCMVFRVVFRTVAPYARRG